MSKRYVGPYINFQGRAREAMEFYHQVLGGDLELQSVNEKGEAKPAGAGDRIATARLEADGAVIIGSDGQPKSPATVGENMGIALGGDDGERMSELFQKLAEGGTIKMPIAGNPGGPQVGWLADRFGINWMVSIEKQ